MSVETGWWEEVPNGPDEHGNVAYYHTSVNLCHLPTAIHDLIADGAVDRVESREGVTELWKGDRLLYTLTQKGIGKQCPI